jgi:2-methylcitrate dehydratase PrpD
VSTSVLANLADQVCGLTLSRIPGDAVGMIRRAFLDTIGVALLGTRLDSAAITARVGLTQAAGTVLHAQSG